MTSILQKAAIFGAVAMALSIIPAAAPSASRRGPPSPKTAGGM
ncbi:hypothetical protein [Nonomuraea sp. LPB2021202275-12-8]